MTTAFIIKTVFEIAAILLLVYGVLHEDKLIKLENKVIKYIAKKIYIRKRKKLIAAKKAAMATKKQNIRTQEIRTNVTQFRYVA